MYGRYVVAVIGSMVLASNKMELHVSERVRVR
jgi:hypothetical protein